MSFGSRPVLSSRPCLSTLVCTPHAAGSSKGNKGLRIDSALSTTFHSFVTAGGQRTRTPRGEEASLRPDDKMDARRETRFLLIFCLYQDTLKINDDGFRCICYLCSVLLNLIVMHKKIGFRLGRITDDSLVWWNMCLAISGRT